MVLRDSIDVGKSRRACRLGAVQIGGDDHENEFENKARTINEGRMGDLRRYFTVAF